MRKMRLELFDEDECIDVYQCALRILENVGSDICNERARKLLLDAGCAQDGRLIKIPPSLVEQARSTAPKTVTVYDHNGKPRLNLNARNGGAYVATGVTNLFRLDYETSTQHRTVEKDALDAGMVIDALPGIDIATGLCDISDANPAISNAHEAKALLETTRKPLLLMNNSIDEFRTEVDLCAAVAGGMDAFLDKPFVIAGAPSTPPLTHTDDVLERLLYMFDLGLPTPYVSSPMICASAPSTVTGACVEGLAEVLVGLVLSQLVRPGNPFIGACFYGVMDMKTMNITQSNPEFMLGPVASGSVFRYLDIPFAAAVGCSDSCVFDQQAAADIAAQLYTGLLCGANLIYFSGFLETAMSSSLEALVLCNEMIGMLRHLMQGATTDADSLAEETIAEVGPGGGFITEDHTVEHCRDFWEPSLFVRQDFKTWAAAGSQDCGRRAHEKVRSILEAGVKDPLPDDVQKALDRIISEADERCRTADQHH